MQGFDLTSMSNEQIIELMLSHQVSVHRLEGILGKSNAKRCVEIRRQYYIRQLELLALHENQLLNEQQPKLSPSERQHQSNSPTILEPPSQQQQQQQQKQENQPIISDIQLSSTQNIFPDSPSQLSDTSQISNIHTALSHPNKLKTAVLRAPQSSDFPFDRVVGVCCENVIGYVRLPVGLVGPLKMDNETYYVPLATTEGCLVASTSRGLSVLAKSGGVYTRIRKDCMTRAPIVRFRDTELKDALDNVNRAMEWLQEPKNKERIKTAFRSTSKHTNLINYTLDPIGRELHIRFEAQTGDAMGMNMCSKGAESALKEMQKVFPTMDILTLSGNICTDKKPSAINWIRGRGKSVECNALLTAETVEQVLKVSVDSLIEVWLKKVMIGSARAGSIGGFNCHAANIVAAIYIATGQDAAQVVSSSSCLLTLEKDSRGSLAVHCSMPSIECGTVGGGTILPDQSSYLQLMGIQGSKSNSNNVSTIDDYETNACKLARIICSTVMAAELSLLASLTEGTLVKSHMTHNRSNQPCKVV